MKQKRKLNIDLLRASAKHWRENARDAREGREYVGGCSTCPLCDKYNYNPPHCPGCPLSDYGLGCDHGSGYGRHKPHNKWSPWGRWYSLVTELPRDWAGEADRKFSGKAIWTAGHIARCCDDLADWLEKGGDLPPEKGE